MKKYYVYVIRSLKTGSLYKGHCENVEKRLKEHNSGQTKSIKHLVPFELVYFEEYLILNEAISREKYFKSAAGRKFLKIKLSPLI